MANFILYEFQFGKLKEKKKKVKQTQQRPHQGRREQAGGSRTAQFKNCFMESEKVVARGCEMGK